MYAQMGVYEASAALALLRTYHWSVMSVTTSMYKIACCLFWDKYLLDQLLQDQWSLCLENFKGSAVVKIGIKKVPSIQEPTNVTKLVCIKYLLTDSSKGTYEKVTFRDLNYLSLFLWFHFDK